MEYFILYTNVAFKYFNVIIFNCILYKTKAGKITSVVRCLPQLLLLQ